jgi:hypothetical protein
VGHADGGGAGFDDGADVAVDLAHVAPIDAAFHCVHDNDTVSDTFFSVVVAAKLLINQMFH